MTKQTYKVIGIIPARLGSTRFPRKVLAPILGKPMIQHVWEAASASEALDEVMIATEDLEVQKVATTFGAKAILTPNHFQSGSERVAWVAREYDRECRADIIINIQGDEPLLSSETLSLLVNGLIDSNCDFSTPVVLKNNAEELNNPNVVKAVGNKTNHALYFSRQPLAMNPEGAFLKHIGIYAYWRAALLRFCELPPSPLELCEKLEQLRALENGMGCKLVQVDSDTVAVDRPEDLVKVEEILKRKITK